MPIMADPAGHVTPVPPLTKLCVGLVCAEAVPWALRHTPDWQDSYPQR